MKSMGFAEKRRILIVPFEHELKPEEYDLNLAKKMRAEMPYIIGWALKGLERLEASNYVFTESPESKKELEELVMRNNSVATFYAEHYVIDDGAKPIHSKDVYDFYCSWASSNGHERMSNNLFGRRFKEFAGEPRQTTSDGVNGKYYYIRRIDQKQLVQQSLPDTPIARELHGQFN
jgi:phage/plasmid-associated DNA primase